MAKRRLEVAERKRRAERERTADEYDNTKEEVVKAISTFSSEKGSSAEAFTRYDKARHDEIKSLRSEVQLYRTLSTAGITAATFSHESRGNPLKVITQSIRAIERRVKQNLNKQYDELFSKLSKASIAQLILLKF